MPTAQYVNPTTNTRVTKEFPTPKKVGDLDAWYKSVRKVLPALPDVTQANADGWHVERTEATLTAIRWDLRSRTGHKAYLIVLRKSAQF